MVGAGMLRVLRQHLAQRGEDGRGAEPGLAVGGPQLPGIGVHQPLGEHRLDVHVVREAAGDILHGGDVGGEERGAVRRVERPGAVEAFRQGRDQRLLDRARRGRVGLRLAERLPAGAGARLRHDRHVVIGPEGQRDAPIAGRALWIELGRFGEGAGRLVMVEGPEQAHALVEIFLRFRRGGGDRPVEGAEAVEQLGAFRPVRDGGARRRRMVLVLGERGRGEDQCGERKETDKVHVAAPPCERKAGVTPSTASAQLCLPMRSMGRGDQRSWWRGDLAQAFAVARPTPQALADHPSTMLRMVPLPIWRWGGKGWPSRRHGATGPRWKRPAFASPCSAATTIISGTGPTRRSTGWSNICFGRGPRSGSIRRRWPSPPSRPMARSSTSPACRSRAARNIKFP